MKRIFADIDHRLIDRNSVENVQNFIAEEQDP